MAYPWEEPDEDYDEDWGHDDDYDDDDEGDAFSEFLNERDENGRLVNQNCGATSPRGGSEMGFSETNLSRVISGNVDRGFSARELEAVAGESTRYSTKLSFRDWVQDVDPRHWRMSENGRVEYLNDADAKTLVERAKTVGYVSYAQAMEGEKYWWEVVEGTAEPIVERTRKTFKEWVEQDQDYYVSSGDKVENLNEDSAKRLANIANGLGYDVEYVEASRYTWTVQPRAMGGTTTPRMSFRQFAKSKSWYASSDETVKDLDDRHSKEFAQQARNEGFAVKVIPQGDGYYTVEAVEPEAVTTPTSFSAEALSAVVKDIKTIMTLNRQGEFSANFSDTERICGATGARRFKYEVEIRVRDNGLDSNGFVVDTNEIQNYFTNRWERVRQDAVSCEEIAKEVAAYWTTQVKDAISVKVRISPMSGRWAQCEVEVEGKDAKLTKGIEDIVQALFAAIRGGGK